MGIMEFLTVLVVVGLPMLLLYRVVDAALRRRDRGYGTDEAGLMQDMHSQLLKMEKRIESLETILIDRLDTPPPVPRESAEYSGQR